MNAVSLVEEEVKVDQGQRKDPSMEALSVLENLMMTKIATHIHVQVNKHRHIKIE